MRRIDDPAADAIVFRIDNDPTVDQDVAWIFGIGVPPFRLSGGAAGPSAGDREPRRPLPTAPTTAVPIDAESPDPRPGGRARIRRLSSGPVAGSSESFDDFLKPRPPESFDDLSESDSRSVALTDLVREFDLSFSEGLRLCREADIPGWDASTRLSQANADRFRWFAGDPATIERIRVEPDGASTGLIHDERPMDQATRSGGPFIDPLAGQAPVVLEHDRRAARNTLVVGMVLVVVGAGVSILSAFTNLLGRSVVWYGAIVLGMVELGRGFRKREETKRAEHTLAMQEHHKGWPHELG